jgi:hypothetical protein
VGKGAERRAHRKSQWRARFALSPYGVLAAAAALGYSLIFIQWICNSRDEISPSGVRMRPAARGDKSHAEI